MINAIVKKFTSNEFVHPGAKIETYEYHDLSSEKKNMSSQ